MGGSKGLSERIFFWLAIAAFLWLGGGLAVGFVAGA